MLKRPFVFFLLISSQCFGSEKMYLDSTELDLSHNAFRIHVGNNTWLETQEIKSDLQGVYTYTNSIILSNSEYQKKWRCPYCYMFWPIGSRCQNTSCPSKY